MSLLLQPEQVHIVVIIIDLCVSEESDSCLCILIKFHTLYETQSKIYILNRSWYRGACMSRSVCSARRESVPVGTRDRRGLFELSNLWTPRKTTQ